MSGTGTEKIPNLPKRRVPVSRPYRANTGTPGFVIEGVPIPGAYLGGRMYRTYLSVRCQYWKRTGITEVSVPVLKKYRITDLSGVGLGVHLVGVPNLPKCRVPVSISYRTLRYGSVGNSPRKFPGHALVRTPQNILFEFIPRLREGLGAIPGFYGLRFACSCRMPSGV